MTREQIEKAAREYSDVIWNNDRARDISKIAYSVGAQWRINSVWHDAKERPEIDRKLLTCFGSEYCEIDCLRKEDFDWEYYADKRGIVRWAYVEDLLPERKEEAE